jgi:hypothetical protein
MSVNFELFQELRIQESYSTAIVEYDYVLA